MNNNELIDYLKDKGMSNETIARVLFYCRNKENMNYYDKIKFIFNILGYAGLTDDQIGLVLNINPAIVDRSNSDIVKNAAVLSGTGMIDEIFSKERSASRYLRYKRIFMRNIIAERSTRYSKSLSPDVLVCEDTVTYGKLKFYEDVYNVLNARVNSDAELEDVLNKSLMINGQHVTVDEYINKLAVMFFNKYKMREIKRK